MEQYGGFDSLVEQVYYSAIGMAVEESRVPSVIDQYGPQGKCHGLYNQMRDAYERVCARLGVDEEDSDLDQIVDLMEDISKEVAFEMFRCGAMFQNSNILR